MGDSREAKFIFGETCLKFYTHWDGTNLPENLQRAIEKARPRWTDESYCLRIIISQLVGADWDSETGSGIIPSPTKSYDCDFNIDLKEQTIKYIDWDNEVSFDVFTKMDVDNGDFK